MTLPPIAATHIQAAQECLKKGDHAGAEQALGQLGSESLDHPDALEIRWELAAHAENWDSALALSKALCQLTPESEYAWLGQACSLHELGRKQEAFDILVAAFQKLPKSPMIAYNLACGACRLKRHDEAWQWLTKAIEIGGRAEVKLMALDDPDLAPLLDQICAL
jgi:predicted Zn-dependent protease